MQLSASKTDLLLACSYPFDRRLKGVVSTAGPEAIYGSAFHELISTLKPCTPTPAESKLVKSAKMMLKKWSVVDVTPEELASHVARTHSYVRRWIEREGFLEERCLMVFDYKTGADPAMPKESGQLKTLGIAVHRLFRDGLAGGRRYLLGKEMTVSCEESIAYNPWDDAARNCDGPGEGHIYRDAGEDEIPGTTDLVFAPVIRDRSTNFFDEGVTVGIIHTPLSGMVTIQTAQLGPSGMAEHRKALRRAMSRIGDDSMRPGGHCTGLYCPAIRVCPSKTSALATLQARGIVWSYERVGEVHQTLELYDHLSKQLRAEMRAWIDQNGPGIRRDGKLVVLRKSERENLSKASIERGLVKLHGPEKGHHKAAKMIEMLRESGCIETSERTEMRAEPDRGR